ncbi:hypothetical protein GCM10007100_40200 [Roseibacillus persicicus]|uniref:Uncharacterized protein n=1 Tax=Roseibacillus persicicus TaxID=454148 RepID=A0A918WQL2_9BACT|nr:hypothetical protein GCM10007100_40200 [Roseibacillus persicicus]
MLCSASSGSKNLGIDTEKSSLRIHKDDSKSPIWYGPDRCWNDEIERWDEVEQGVAAETDRALGDLLTGSLKVIEVANVL